MAKGHIEPEIPMLVTLGGLGGNAELPSGYVIDYVSGKPVRGTPEELFATQVFARRLVEDFDYPKDRIITRPQYRVRVRPIPKNLIQST